jgi:DNA-binding transcriptional ArsR family regulator
VDIVFAALAHPARRHVLLLLSHLGGELSSGYLAARFHHTWPTTTRHLKVLEEAGLVEVHREGRSSQYRLNRERLQRVLGGWQRHLEPVGPEQTWTSSGPKSTDGLGDTTRGRRPKITEASKRQQPRKGDRR